MLSFFAKKTPRAILVHVEFYALKTPDLSELQALAETAGVQVLSSLCAHRDRPDAKLFVGKGKAAELAERVTLECADLVLFNHDLSPSQERNLTKELGCQVMNRTALILEIFAQRARTHEGKLQVELAHLQYQATRLVRGWTHLERQRGGIGVRGGPGETQLEIDKRLLRHHIKSLKNQLDKVRETRQLSRSLRKKSAIPSVALVGYTNTGKSTLFNALTTSSVYVANQLFATLDPTLRQITLPQYGEIVLADTVGFIQHLPHHLVDAFKATLEEVAEADLLLHVMDASHPDWLSQKEEVLKVLAEIGAGKQPILEVMNKIDLCENKTPRLELVHCNALDQPKPSVLPGSIQSAEKGELLDFLSVSEQILPQRVWISVLKRWGIDLLLQAILGHLSQHLFQADLLLPARLGAIRSALYDWKAVQHEVIDEDGVFHLTLCVAESRLSQLFKQHHEEYSAYLDPSI